MLQREFKIRRSALQMGYSARSLCRTIGTALIIIAILIKTSHGFYPLSLVTTGSILIACALAISLLLHAISNSIITTTDSGISFTGIFGRGEIPFTALTQFNVKTHTLFPPTGYLASQNATCRLPLDIGELHLLIGIIRKHLDPSQFLAIGKPQQIADFELQSRFREVFAIFQTNATRSFHFTMKTVFIVGIIVSLYFWNLIPLFSGIWILHGLLYPIAVYAVINAIAREIIRKKVAKDPFTLALPEDINRYPAIAQALSAIIYMAGGIFFKWQIFSRFT